MAFVSQRNEQLCGLARSVLSCCLARAVTMRIRPPHRPGATHATPFVGLPRTGSSSPAGAPLTRRCACVGCRLGSGLGASRQQHTTRIHAFPPFSPLTAQALRGLVAEDAAFKADGVIYTTDTTGKQARGACMVCVACAETPPNTPPLSTGREAILDALEREHKTHEHTTYAPVAVAADEDKRLAFVAVAWELKNTASNRCANARSRGHACVCVCVCARLEPQVMCAHACIHTSRCRVV
jgi:hypothetical protein